MIGPIEQFMTADHARLDQLLELACRSDGAIDGPTFAVFREGLLRHIAMEEKVLLPYLRARVGEPPSIARVLRRDHGEIASLLVPSPTSSGCDLLRGVLARHNPLEEGPDGLYAACDTLAGGDAREVVAQLRAQPPVPVAPHYDGPLLKGQGVRRPSPGRMP